MFIRISSTKIRNIYGAAKIYDTRVGIDTNFGDSLLNNSDLNKIAKIGNEFGTVTGRSRKVNWLNIEKLIEAVNISGTNIIIISKTDVLDVLGKFKLSNDKTFHNLELMKLHIKTELLKSCNLLEKVIFQIVQKM